MTVGLYVAAFVLALALLDGALGWQHWRRARWDADYESFWWMPASIAAAAAYIAAVSLAAMWLGSERVIPTAIFVPVLAVLIYRARPPSR